MSNKLTKNELHEDIVQVLDNSVAHEADYVKHPGAATSTNTGNAYSVTLDPAPTSYVNHMGIILTINADSTGASTLNVNGLGAKKILKANGSAVTNLKANGIYTVRYNPSADGGSGAFILQGEGASGNAVASDLLSGKTATTDAGDIVGTMPNRGTFNLPLGATVPAGYYSGGNVPSGKRYLSGTATSSSTGVTYNFYHSGTRSQPVVTVNGLGFTPSEVFLFKSDRLNNYGTFYSANMNGAGGSGRDIYLDGYAIAEVNVNDIRNDGFTLPVYYYSTNYDWYAFG